MKSVDTGADITIVDVNNVFKSQNSFIFSQLILSNDDGSLDSLALE